MADGSRDRRIDPKQMNDLTFFASDPGLGDRKKCSGQTLNGDSVKLSFYTELKPSESCEKSDTSGVAAAVGGAESPKSNASVTDYKDDRKKRCFDRYDSSESSDSGVALLSPTTTESGGCSGSDITEPCSPRSPESSSSNEDSAGTRMPPWASEPAPPARRIPAQPAPLRRPKPHPPTHRRITEYFNHKMKPQNGLKRDSTTINNDDTKRKCLPKNGVTHDLEKYISYLSQTLSPKVLLDVGKQTAAVTQKPYPIPNGAVDSKITDLNKTPSSAVNGILDFSKSVEYRDKNHTTMNGFVEMRHPTEFTKDKLSTGLYNGFVDNKKPSCEIKQPPDPSASKGTMSFPKRKIPIPASSEMTSLRIAPATSANQSPKKMLAPKSDKSKMNGIVSSTTMLDSKMNGVTCGSNNLSLNPLTPKPAGPKKEAQKRTAQPSKRTNRKSSACIANSKNLTWSKANNLKHVQLQQKQNCVNSMQNVPVKTMQGETNEAPKITVSNGVRQMPITMNGSLGNLNVPATNFQNCHPISITQPCNGSLTSTNIPSFVAVPPNVMLTALRIPQNGIPAQNLNQQNNMQNMNAFNRQNVNVNVPSPTKLNGQFVFPLMQNLNGAVVQIPNLMAKMPNFVLPQTSQLTAQRQDHLHNQQAAQILINGTLLKLGNTMSTSFANVNKPVTVSSQSMPVMNKNVPAMHSVGMTVQSKPNYTVNLSHPGLIMSQPGFIVTSVPNVKETWSYTSTNSVSSSQTTCSNPIVQHPSPIVANFTTQALHTSSIPIAPVKPPDNPIQGTDPPSSTVMEPDEIKCEIPWLSKTVNNNFVPLDNEKISSRAFVKVSSFTEKVEELTMKKEEILEDKHLENHIKDSKELRKVVEVARREETIFTQITVLKDVSSNVQNTVIETNFCSATTESSMEENCSLSSSSPIDANFCSATTESSESGIGSGTDKSIDSPTDSQTSKECDDDSSLSLSVSVCSVDVQSQKSPILKQPKTLRFPPRIVTKTNGNKRTSSTDTSSTGTICLWENCKRELDSDCDLLEHLQSVHVETQAGKENYVCLWEQCKVRGKPSCSRLWLERHALSHGGNKPFKCIVDGCDRRFSTQTLLERHVNHHFNVSSPNTSGSKKTADSAPKLIRRNGKKLRYRRQPWSARMFDFFDASTMEGLSWRLLRCTRWRLGGGCPLREPPGAHTLTLHAVLMATRYNATEARREALVTYYPPHVIEDEWVPEKDVKRIKRVEIAALPVSSKVVLYEQFCASYKKKPASLPSKRLSTPVTPKLQPARSTSSRLLNNLLKKQKKEFKDDCSTKYPVIFKEDEKERVEVSGAKKRKLGRRYGGNAFWPCGR